MDTGDEVTPVKKANATARVMNCMLIVARLWE